MKNGLNDGRILKGLLLSVLWNQVLLTNAVTKLEVIPIEFLYSASTVQRYKLLIHLNAGRRIGS